MDSKSCVESIFDDIVKVEIYPAEQSQISLPANILVESVADGTLFSGSAALVMSLSRTGILMQTTASLKVSNARQQAGNIYTHDLQASVNLSRYEAQKAVNSLQRKDFHIIYTHYDGTRSLTYSLPNASLVDIEENFATGATVTVKVKALSMSPLIQLT